MFRCEVFRWLSTNGALTKTIGLIGDLEQGIQEKAVPVEERSKMKHWIMQANGKSWWPQVSFRMVHWNATLLKYSTAVGWKICCMNSLVVCIVDGIVVICVCKTSCPGKQTYQLHPAGPHWLLSRWVVTNCALPFKNSFMPFICRYSQWHTLAFWPTIPTALNLWEKTVRKRAQSTAILIPEKQNKRRGLNWQP